jgi:hypothetical protein
MFNIHKLIEPLRVVATWILNHLPTHSKLRLEKRWRWIRASDDPEVLAPLRVYIIGEGRHRWKAMMRCPCGCDDIIQLSLHKSGRPRWTATTHLDGRITLRPSVWKLTGCRSHFILERGRIIDCLSYGNGASVNEPEMPTRRPQPSTSGQLQAPPPSKRRG